MNKTAIKNFSMWARRKLIDDISNKARLVGISEKGINDPLLSSTDKVQFFDVGTKEPYSISGISIRQREVLIKEIQKRALDSDHKSAYTNLLEEVAYTWFNRLIAIRFMEVNNYLPSRIRVLSSEADNKMEPDIVTSPFSAILDYTEEEKKVVQQLKYDNKLDDLFRMLFIKQCNSLNENLPELFEKTNDYTELLLELSFTDRDGIVNHLVNDITEDDFDVNKEGQVEIIGWLYQYYNEERKNQVINIYKGKVGKDDIPAATQLFTTDWVVRYMIDNSLGRYWIERNPDSSLKNDLEYFVKSKEAGIIYIDEKVTPEELTVLDPCMGSGHILVYAFDVLMMIYKEKGYSERDAAKNIVEKNLFGLDIDKRAYQLAYFAIMMKGRSYDRRFLARDIKPNVFPIIETNSIKRFKCEGLTKDHEMITIGEYLVDAFKDAKEIGSLVSVKDYDYRRFRDYLNNTTKSFQMTFDTSYWFTDVLPIMKQIAKQADIMSRKYVAVSTNPPYLNKLQGRIKQFIEDEYKPYSGDLFSVFMYRNFDYCIPNGYSAFMTPFVWMFIKTYEQMRDYIINNKSITTLIQMEYSAFEEATVPICTFVLKNKKILEKGVYIKLSAFKGGMEVQKEKVLEAINNNCNYIYEKDLLDYTKIPSTPIAYWASENIFKAFEESKALGEIASPRQGLATGDNNRFIRMWYEIEIDNVNFSAVDQIEADKSKKKWFPYNKGGQFRKWYGNNDYVINWGNSGNEVSSFKGSVIRNKAMYFKPSVTWSKISSGSISFRYKPKGHLFDVAGTSIFATNELMRYLLGFCNSKVALEIANIISPTLNYEVGHISNFPIIIDTNMKSEIETLVSQNIEVSNIDWDSFEISWDFNAHPLLRSGNIDSAYNEVKKEYEERFTTLKSNEKKLNRIFIEIYGLQNELKPDIEDKDVTVSKIYDTKNDVPESMRTNSFILTKQDLVKSFLSYAVGCMFGRYSLDIEGLAYAGGDWDNSRYKSFFPDKDNVIPITDEEYFKDDIVGLFVSFVNEVYGEDKLEKNLSFIADALDNKGDSSREVIRDYFLNDFFKDHVKTYKSRPIYWLFDSGKQNGFKALVYLHRYSEDTIGKLRIDYLHRLQKVYENEIARMQKTIEESTDSRDIAKATKRKEKLIKQLQETREHDEKITHLALEKITLDLDDGVKANYEKIQTDREGRKHQVLAKI